MKPEDLELFLIMLGMLFFGNYDYAYVKLRFKERRRVMRLIDADAFNKQVAAMTIKENYPVEKANAMMKLIDMQPTVLDMADIMAQLEKRINTQLQIITGLNDPVYKYGFTKSLEAYQQCRLILEDAIHEN